MKVKLGLPLQGVILTDIDTGTVYLRMDDTENCVYYNVTPQGYRWNCDLGPELNDAFNDAHAKQKAEILKGKS